MLHANALLPAKRKPVTILIDTSSFCNILQKGYYKEHGLVVQLCEKKLKGLNGSTSKVMSMVNVLVNIAKWSFFSAFYVLNYGTDLIIRYLSLKKMRLPVTVC